MTKESDLPVRCQNSTIGWTRIGFGLLLIALPAVGATDSGAAGSFRRVAPVKIAGDAALENNQALKFMQADTSGRVFLLHGDRLQIDQILPSGKIVVAHAAVPAGGAVAVDWVADAAMSPDGDAWLLERRCAAPLPWRQGSLRGWGPRPAAGAASRRTPRSRTGSRRRGRREGPRHRATPRHAV
jgi:hypothetical protein